MKGKISAWFMSQEILKLSLFFIGNTMESKHSNETHPELYDVIKKDSEEMESTENIYTNLRNRRCAVNITSNPVYRVSSFLYTIIQLVVFLSEVCDILGFKIKPLRVISYKEKKLYVECFICNEY